MSFRITETALCGDVGRMLGDELRSRYGDLSSPVKRLARDLGVSEPTARQMFSGRLPATGTLLLALKQIGSRAALRVMGPVVGDMPGADEFEQMREIRLRLDRLIERASDGLATATTGRDPLAAAEGERAGSAGAGRGSAEQGRPDRPAPGLAAEPVALVSTRRSFDAIGPDAEIRRLLSFGNVVSLDAARNLKASSRNLGIAYREKGGDWIVDPAANNRLWKGSVGPRPLSAFPSHSYAETVRRGFVEAVASDAPQCFEHVGWSEDQFIHAVVARKGWVTADGYEAVAAAFERAA